MAKPVLIWGAGAVGATIGAYWVRDGIDVLFVDVDRDHVEACRTTGLSIEGPVDAFTVRVPGVMPDELEGEYSCIVLAVKAHATRDAIIALEPHLADDGFVISAQNGLNEITIAEHIGQRRTIGAFVNFGADLIGPGRILFGNRGAVVLGELVGPVRVRTQTMHRLMQRFEPNAELTENIWGFLWGKLAYGAMLFATALNMDSMADNFADVDRFPVWLALGREVMAVAGAKGVRPVGFNGFDPMAFTAASAESAARESVANVAAFNRRSAKTHSGVWRDLAVWKRRTEIDSQIGVVNMIGGGLGIATPVIDRLVELVHDIEAGRRSQSVETFNELLAKCT